MKKEKKVGDGELVPALIAAFIVGFAVASLFVMDWLGLDTRKWFGFEIWTGFVFGCLMAKFAEDLEKTRCLLVYLTLVALHVTVLMYYLRSAKTFPNIFFLFFSPFEAGIGAIVLMMLGGAQGRLPRRSKPTHERRWPPDRT